MCIYVEYLRSWKPLDTECLLNVFCTFNLRPVSTVKYVCKTCQSIQYKDSFVENYPIKKQLDKSVSGPMIA